MKRFGLTILIGVAISALAGACSGGDDSSCDASCRDRSEAAAGAINDMAYPLKQLVSAYANVTTSLSADFTDDCITYSGTLAIASNAGFGFPELVSGSTESTWACVSITGGPLAMEDIVDGSGGWEYHLTAPDTFVVDGHGCEVDVTVVEIDDYPSDLHGSWCGGHVAPLPGDG